ncbi:MAG TPA: hypothetical protein VFS21_31140 [Roseiflexaceae bacterium]|nr:hypothetical protein [Roseiflexaceae bacterium]
MSRNQLLAIVGVLLVLGVALQRGAPFQIVPNVVCPLCSWSMVLPGPSIIRAPGEVGPAFERRLQPNMTAEYERVLKDWIATPEPLFAPFVPPPTATPPHDAGRSWHMDCLDC